MSEAFRTNGMYAQALAAIAGQQPERPPFITRLEAWYKSHTRSGTLPERFEGMSLGEVHKAVGVGQLKFMAPYAFKLRQVEVRAYFNSEPVYQEWEPTIENFPGMWDLVSTERAGETETTLSTPVGELHLKHKLLSEGVFSGTDPYLVEHLIKEETDYRTAVFILEHAEYVPQYKKACQAQIDMGDDAFVVPLLQRIPFQQVLLEYLGETAFFYALYDNPAQVQKLLALLDEQLLDILGNLKELTVPYVEFPDNITGTMANPRLFRQYCLPVYQRYCDILHGQDKKAGSHSDGNLKPLLNLLAETGLDVCESVSPYPLTECTFEEIWKAWEMGPLVWGGIPSPILEENTSEAEFENFMQRIFEVVGQKPIIYGVVDLFMRHNSIERVAYIAHQLTEKVRA